MQVDLSRFRDAFFDEAVERQQELETGLLRLESAHDDPETLNSVFRAAHSIKGSSGVFELADITRFTHELESLLDRMRKSALPVAPALIGLLLRAADVLGALIARARANEAPPPGLDSMLAELRAASGATAADAPLATPVPAPAGVREVEIGIVPGPMLFQRGSDPLLLLRELAQLGRAIEVRADLARLPDLAHLDPERCWIAWTVRLATDASAERLREVFAFVEDDCQVRIVDAAQPPAPAAPLPAAKAAAPDSGDAREERRAGGDRRHSEASSIRVAVEKVDQLIDLVGELVIAQSMLTQALDTPSPRRAAHLREAIGGMQRNIRDLQERVMAVRMVPIGTAFARFQRVVRDLAASTGKSVALVVEGEETELDKSVVERIGDPLTHLVRNCIDHGIEPPHERARRGKPDQGTIAIRSFHECGNVVVEVADDGRGLDLDRIRAKAVACGRAAAAADIGDAEARALIFEPGFSTADEVSDISGRGVGMDVVRRTVDALNGSVAVESEAGRGTRFRIRLPLTLAILDGLLLGVGERVFVLPLLAIVESFRPAESDVVSVLGRGEMARVRGDAIPLLRLGALFGSAGARARADRGVVVIVDHGGARVGLHVDSLLGESQVVIKNLEKNYGRVEGVMGATILGDGTVALILDVQGLMRLAHGGAGARFERTLDRARELASATVEAP